MGSIGGIRDRFETYRCVSYATLTLRLFAHTLISFLGYKCVAVLVNGRDVVEDQLTIVRGSVYRVVGTIHYVDDFMLLSALSITFLSSPETEG